MEAHYDVGDAVVLLTPDDEGASHEVAHDDDVIRSAVQRDSHGSDLGLF